MNPKHHALYVKLCNIGIPAAKQADIPEYNRFVVHSDAVSAVHVTFANDGNDPAIVRNDGRDITDNFIEGLRNTFRDSEVLRLPGHYGTTGYYDRKRLIALLQGMDSVEVKLSMLKDDCPLHIRGSYDRESVDVECILMPRLPMEGEE